MLALERGFFCVMVMLVLFSWSTNATSQTPYSSRVEPPFTYVAYQPVLAGHTVTATGVATTSNNSGANFCTYLYKNGVLVGTYQCGWVGPGSTPKTLSYGTYCNPGYTFTFQTLVRRVDPGYTWHLWSPSLVVTCPR